jgi:hypothetical protein
MPSRSANLVSVSYIRYLELPLCSQSQKAHPGKVEWRKKVNE